MPKRKVSKRSGDASTKRNKVEPKPVTLETNFQQGDLLFGLTGKLKRKHLEFLKPKYRYFKANKLNNPPIYMVMEDSNWTVDDLTEERRKHYEMLKKNQEYLESQVEKTYPIMKGPIELELLFVAHANY